MITNRLWIIGTILIIAVLLIGTYVIAVAPQLATAAANAVEAQTVRAQNAAHEATLKDLEDKDKNIDSLRAQLKEVQEAVPATAAQSPLIDEIGDIALGNGVLVENIKFGDPAAYIPADSTDPEVMAAAPGLSSGNFLVIPVEVTVSGPVYSALDFLRDLQKAKRLYLAYQVTFEAADDDPATDLARFTIKGQVFVLTSFAGAAGDTVPVTDAPAS